MAIPLCRFVRVVGIRHLAIFNRQVVAISIGDDVIISHIDGRHDTCRQCGNVGGRHLRRDGNKALVVAVIDILVGISALLKTGHGGVVAHQDVDFLGEVTGRELEQAGNRSAGDGIGRVAVLDGHRDGRRSGILLQERLNDAALRKPVSGNGHLDLNLALVSGIVHGGGQAVAGDLHVGNGLVPGDGRDRVVRRAGQAVDAVAGNSDVVLLAAGAGHSGNHRYVVGRVVDGDGSRTRFGRGQPKGRGRGHIRCSFCSGGVDRRG